MPILPGGRSALCRSMSNRCGVEGDLLALDRTNCRNSAMMFFYGSRLN